LNADRKQLSQNAVGPRGSSLNNPYKSPAFAYPVNAVLLWAGALLKIVARRNNEKGLKIFRDGDFVLASGRYRVFHSTPHTWLERDFCLGGDRFPGCRLCPFGVLYRLEARFVPDPFTTTPAQEFRINVA
jgi:hypothetical protein